MLFYMCPDLEFATAQIGYFGFRLAQRSCAHYRARRASMHPDCSSTRSENKKDAGPALSCLRRGRLALLKIGYRVRNKPDQHERKSRLRCVSANLSQAAGRALIK